MIELYNTIWSSGYLTLVVVLLITLIYAAFWLKTEFYQIRDRDPATPEDHAAFNEFERAMRRYTRMKRGARK